MPSVLIVIEARSPSCVKLAASLERAIVADSPHLVVETLPASELATRLECWQPGDLLCPLTLDLPDGLPIPVQQAYVICQDSTHLQQQVAKWGIPTDVGNLWLPIVLTAKGALFAEVIGRSPDNAESKYFQPVELSDRWRQPLYQLGFRLLRSINALPSVYLMQFGIQAAEICFDRLLPFPGEPAIASIKLQTPDLFACHWHCLRGQPIHDLTINALSEYGAFPQA